MRAQAIKSQCVRRLCIAVGSILFGAMLLFGCAYLAVASWNQRGGSPANITVAPDGTLYVSDNGQPPTMFSIAGRCIWIISSQNDRVVGLVKVNQGDGIGVAPNGKVYVLPTWAVHRSSVDVQVFDPSTARISQITLLSSGFKSIAFTPTGRALLLGKNELLYVVDTTTDRFDGTVLPAPGKSIAALSESKFYVAGAGVAVIDGGVRWVHDIPRDYTCIDITVASEGRAFASYRQGSYKAYQFGVLVLDTHADTMIRDIPLPDQVVGMVPLPDGRFYALCTGPDGAYYVSAVDSQTGNILKTIRLEQEPYGYESQLGKGQIRRRMALAPNGKIYIVRGEDFGQLGKPDSSIRGIGVYVVDPSTDTVIDFIPLEPPLWVRLFPF